MLSNELLSQTYIANNILDILLGEYIPTVLS